MRWQGFLLEALATTLSSKIPSVLMAAVVAATCFASIVTVGRSAAEAADVAGSLEEVGARRLSVIDTQGTGFINSRTLGVVVGISTVKSASALGVPFDTFNGSIGRGGNRLPTWPVLGDVSAVATMTRGRLPLPGEAIVSTEQLRTINLVEPLGYLVGPDGARQFPIVGSFTPKAPYADLSSGAIVGADPQLPAQELRVVVDNFASAEATVSGVMSTLRPQDARSVSIESPERLAATARKLNEKLSGYGRVLLLLILAIGGFFVCAVTLTDVLVRRRDLGRRRTLGITRLALIGIVTVRALLTGFAGAILGCLTGGLTNQAQGHPTPYEFIVAVGVLAAVASMISAVPPAWYAAHLDPAQVMRTP